MTRSGRLAAHLCGILVILAGGGVAFPCLAPYRSPDWLAFRSPLIVVGEIERVRPFTDEERRADPDGFAMKAPKESPGPTVSMVRVLRVIKGECVRRRLEVVSGPIRSCAMWPVHYRFEKGQRKLLILPDDPVEGRVGLHWGGSVRPLRDAEMVEACVHRTEMLRRSYVEGVKEANPESYAAALKLAARIRQITGELDGSGKEFVVGGNVDSKLPEARQKLIEEFSACETTTIRLVGAVDPGLLQWSVQYLWRAAAGKLGKARASEVADLERTRIRHLLGRAGVDEKHISAYLASFDDEDFRGSITFPFGIPAARDKQATDLVTTEFILRYHSLDRGMMYRSYGSGGGGHPKLDPDRVGPTLLAMLGSADGNLARIAGHAMRRIPGTAFVKTAYDEILSRGRQGWRLLKHPETPAVTETRLSALVDLAMAGGSEWKKARFWRALRSEECFLAPCPKRAEALLAETPEKEEDLRAALSDYLKAARSAGGD